jgi:hypothetical protein
VKPLTKLPFNFFGKNYLRRALQTVEERYIGNAYIFKPAEQDRIWKGGTLNRQERLSLKPYFDAVRNESDSRKMQYIDLNFWLAGDILAKADKMTMAHSLELRVPFLDIEVGKLSARIPDSLKYKDGKTKYILRKAFEAVLPQETADRKKLGFPTPMRIWLKERPEEIMDIITQCPYIQKKFNEEHIEQLMRSHLKGKGDNSRKIYLLLMLALWYNVYMKGAPEFGLNAKSNAEQAGAHAQGKDGSHNSNTSMTNPLMKKESASTKIGRKLKSGSGHGSTSGSKGGFLEIIVVVVVALVLLNVLGIDIKDILAKPWVKDFAQFIWGLLKIVWQDVLVIVAFIKDLVAGN